MSWNCMAKRFCSPKYDFWKGLRGRGGGFKNVFKLATTYHILRLPH